jgi:spermidine/putrescine transport system ATP-binding protein
MSDRIAVIANGKVEQVGSPEEIYARPATAYVAGFLGSANIFDAEVTGHLRQPRDMCRLGRTISAEVADDAPAARPRSWSAPSGSPSATSRRRARPATTASWARCWTSSTSAPPRRSAWTSGDAQVLLIQIANQAGPARSPPSG